MRKSNDFYTKEGFLNMKSISLENFIAERIEENKSLFTREELKFIETNKKCLDKMYLLGAMNSKDCYKI